MKNLDECPVEPLRAGRRREASGEYIIRDPRSFQTLTVRSDEPLVVYTLDHEDVEWPSEEKRPDAVIIGEVEGVSVVCFIELKASMRDRLDKQPKIQRSIAQLDAGLRHFCPSGQMRGHETHGDEHHARWRDGEDELPVMPDREHRVATLAVTYRQLPRPLAGEVESGGRKVWQAAVQLRQSGFNRAEIEFKELLRKAAVPLG